MMNIIKLERKPSIDDSHLPDTIPPLLRQLYAKRGIQSANDLDKNLIHLDNFELLSGIEKACQLLYDALYNEKRITIVGDYDTDGATSTALSIIALTQLGGKHIDYLIPNRFEHGYGLSKGIVEQAKAKGTDLLVTVDNGISSFDGVDHAHQLGMQVLITDHHLPAMQLPNAEAVVNPNLHECAFPSKSLAGVGVIFYVMLALRQTLRKNNWFQERHISEPNLANLLDLVALGTVADVVSLDKNNRILVSQGLNRIRSGVTRVGITALIDVAKRNARCLVAADLGFSLAPRLNAAGRLDDMSLGVQLLLCDDEKKAKELAVELDRLNVERRDIEQEMESDALNYCSQFDDLITLPSAFVLYHTDWHQGVIGILASRIKERYHRPVIAFAPAGNGVIKGSGRSIAGLHLRDVLEKVSLQQPKLLESFGGHAMAAGVSLREENFAAFQTIFTQVVSESIDKAIFNGLILSDGELSREHFNLETAHLLKYSEPWGQGFPAPLFDGKFKLIKQRLLGDRHLKLLIEPADGGPMLDAIAFNVNIDIWPDPNIKYAYLAYQLDVNHFKGEQNLQLIVEHLWLD